MSPPQHQPAVSTNQNMPRPFMWAHTQKAPNSCGPRSLPMSFSSSSYYIGFFYSLLSPTLRKFEETELLMELLPLYSPIPCYGSLNSNKLVDNIARTRINPRLCSVSKTSWVCLKQARIQHNVTPKAVSENCDYPVTGSDLSRRLRSIPQTSTDEIRKVSIPRLPDNNGDRPGSPISSGFWEWKPKLSVHYERSGTENVGAPSVLFLPGFGVGTFHYEKQLRDLGREYRVWTLDFLGQGMSLPSEDPTDRGEAVWGFGDESQPWAQELVFSIELWHEQVQSFVEQVIGEPVYVVGNSLGGYVALYLAACNPQLVKGVTLLNATPFWGFLPNPVKSPRLSKVFPWSGTFPLPSNVRKLTGLVWQKFSDPNSIREILKQVYADHTTNIDKVFSRIVETTEHPAAAASFASIMFAPKGLLSFQEALDRCQLQEVPICLMYGKEDPWVKPIWGMKVKRQFPEAPYYELTPAGHCPHDEVPEVVNYLLRGWIKNLETHGSVPLALLEEPEFEEYGVCRDLEYVKDEEGSKKSVRVRFLGSNFTLWNEFVSFVRSKVARVRISSR